MITKQAWEYGLSYNAPDGTATGGTPSSIDFGGASYQQNVKYWMRKAITDLAPKRFFMQMASPIDMPKHFGKRIEVYHYIPVLDDRNINDQGIDAQGLQISNGNFWGSSHDVGKITAAMPALDEHGGRKNRFGFSRQLRSGSFTLFGLFYELNRESLDFDSDPDLLKHLSEETFKMLNQVQENQIMLDLVSNAGVTMYGGAATSDAELTGEGTDVSALTWDMLEKLDAQLTKNKSERNIKMLTGSMNTDTRTVASGRVMYVGPELVPAIKRIKDWNGERAFIGIEQYGSQQKPMVGEFGTVGNWHFIEVPEMVMKEDAGATATNANAGYRVGPKGKYNLYYALTVGSDSFNTIDFGFTKGNGAKVKIITKMPGRETASVLEPFGMEGFTSAQWYYGFFCRRPEWIGLCKVVAPL